MFLSMVAPSAKGTPANSPTTNISGKSISVYEPARRHVSALGRYCCNTRKSLGAFHEAIRTRRIDGNQRYSRIKNQRSLFADASMQPARQDNQLMSKYRV